jgi:hypothetical protein
MKRQPCSAHDASLFWDDLNEQLQDPEFAALFAEAQKLLRSTLDECP